MRTTGLWQAAAKWSVGLACLVLLGVPALARAAADEPKRVCVLYFDNNTPKREYDVLQKGLADMLVTDLSAVETLQVVEREKLQAIIDELKLQRSKYFDPKTAQQLGKVAGADLAVTGAFAALEPTMRIDIRLVEVATGKVLLAEKVTGDAKSFFDLQQELVDVFIKALNVKLKASARAKSGATELDALLKYSQGVDAADKGDLTVASATLAQVIKDSPDFKLAKARYAELLKRLEASATKRASLFSSLEEQLLSLAAGITKEGVAPLLGPRPGADQSAYAAWSREQDRGKRLQELISARAVKHHLYLLKLAERTKPEGNAPNAVTVMTPAAQLEVLKLIGPSREATEQLIADLTALSAHHPLARSIQGHPPPAMRALLEQRNLVWAGFVGVNSLAELQANLGRMLITGSMPWGLTHFAYRPSLAQLEPSLVKPGLKHLADAERAAAAMPNGDGDEQRARADAMFQTLDAAAESLLALGRKEDGVAAWQRFLDAYPADRRFREVEKKVREALCDTDECKAFEAALQTCDSGSLMMKAGLELPRVARVDGAAGLKRVKALLDQKCPAKDPAYPQLEFNMTYVSVVGQVAMQALGVGDCKLADEAKAAVVSKGGAAYAMSMQFFSACR